MLSHLATIVRLTGRKRAAGFVALAGLAALTEGMGIVLLVPLLSALGAGKIAGFSLPDWPLATMLALFVALVLLRALLEVLRSLSAYDLQLRVVDGLRRDAIEALLDAEWRALAGMRQSANRAMLITTLERAGEAVSYLAALVRTAVLVLALLAATIALSPVVALGIATGGLAGLVLLGTARRHARALGSLLSARHEGVHLRLEETLSALRLVKSFGRESAEKTRILAAFDRLRMAGRDYVRAASVSRAILQVAFAVVIAVAVWFAVEAWQVAPVYLIAYAALAVRAAPLVETLQQAWLGWSHASPAIAGAQVLIASAAAEAETPPAPPPPFCRELALVDASVRHGEGRAALHRVTLAIPHGAIVAIEGPSGAGKSTLADLLGGLISPDSGAVLVDGTPLAAGARNGWRARVAYVQQDAVLFTGTVRENLLWAEPDAEEDSLVAALDRAGASFVHHLPGGIDHPLAEGGRNLSGGERQRLALARALLRRPDLLILDEATSAVDGESERLIAEAVSALAGATTVLVIGHRGALVDLASLRFHLHEGRLHDRLTAIAR